MVLWSMAQGIHLPSKWNPKEFYRAKTSEYPWNTQHCFFLNLLYSACDWRKWKLCQRLTFSQKSCQKQRLKYLNINRSIKNSYPLAQFYNVMHTFCCCKQLSPFFYLTAEKNKHEYYSFSADCGGGLQTRPTRQITTFIQCHLVTILDFFQ